MATSIGEAAVAMQLSDEERFPELYALRDEDPMLRKRTVPMEVIVIGEHDTCCITLQEPTR
jgi:hypothetical protein